MQAEERLKSGNLEEALTELQAEIRKDPANPQKRTFLFQLHCLLGRWDKALTQLQVLADMDKKTMPMVQTYGAAIKCEELRGEVFAGRRSPLLFGKPEEWMALLIEAASLAGQGKAAEASALRARALEAAPATGAAAAGQRFEWIADGDARLGPMLEAVINGRYYWIPFLRLRSVKVEKPTDLRDLVWAPATITFANGGETVALLPARYPGSEASPDGQIRLARKTEWTACDDSGFLGLGQRVLITDQGELPLLELRELSVEGVDVPAEQPPAAAAPPS
jgi:type VI secretion system protein ImpE